MKSIARGVAGGLVLLACASTNAGEVHKCVDAEGKVTFSDTTCPDAAVQEGSSAAPAGQGGEASPGQPSAPQPDPPATQSPRGTYGGFIDRSRDAAGAVPPDDGN